MKAAIFKEYTQKSSKYNKCAFKKAEESHWGQIHSGKVPT